MVALAPAAVLLVVLVAPATAAAASAAASAAFVLKIDSCAVHITAGSAAPQKYPSLAKRASRLPPRTSVHSAAVDGASADAERKSGTIALTASTVAVAVPF